MPMPPACLLDLACFPAALRCAVLCCAVQVWEGHVVSASLDGLIKIWEPADPASGLIINPTPIFTFPETVGRAGQGRRGREGQQL